MGPPRRRRPPLLFLVMAGIAQAALAAAAAAARGRPAVAFGPGAAALGLGRRQGPERAASWARTAGGWSALAPAPASEGGRRGYWEVVPSPGLGAAAGTGAAGAEAEAEAGRGEAIPLDDVGDASMASSSILAIDPASVGIVPVSPDDPGAEAEAGTPPTEASAGPASRGDEGAAAEAPPAEIPAFVKMFRGSASYISNHRGTTAVYHIPGDLLDRPGFSDLIDDVALSWLLGMKLVVVCGSRRQIDDRIASEGGGDPIRRSSIRVTDAATLRIVKEEAGYVRFEVERELSRALRMVKRGRTGEPQGGDPFVGNVVSGNFYSAQPFGVIDGEDYMYTGFPRKIEVGKIRQVHSANDIVLLTTLGVSPSGEMFNCNSENLAATVAGSLEASKIVYFTVSATAFLNRRTGKTIQHLRVTDARNLLRHYRVKIHPKGFASVDDSGMNDSAGDTGSEGGPEDDAALAAHNSPAVIETLLKAGWAVSALDRGVKRAHILAPTDGSLLQELYTRDGSGTLISRDLYEGIRPADAADVGGISDLIDPLVKAGTLVPRPRDVMERDIRSYYVYTRDGLIVACGQLKRFEGGYAEIGCLVVSRDYRSQGRGDAILGYLERLCLQCGATRVFVLSTQTMEWFVEREFREVGVDKLPPSRRAVYNHSRRSKIYMKHIDGDRDLDAQELWWNR